MKNIKSGSFSNYPITLELTKEDAERAFKICTDFLDNYKPDIEEAAKS